MQRIFIIILFFFGFGVINAWDYNPSSLYETSSFIYEHAFSIGAYYRSSNNLGVYVNTYSTFNSPTTESYESYDTRRVLGVKSKEIKKDSTYYGTAFGGTFALNNYFSFQIGIF